MQFLYDELKVLIGFNDGSKTYIYTRNLQGDILSIIDTTNNAVVGTYTYDSWGNVLSATGEMANINPFRYRGYYFDAETSLYYLQSRYYDAQVGRFINADTLVFLEDRPAAYCVYAYCENNPVLKSDPSGYASALAGMQTAALIAAHEAARQRESQEMKTRYLNHYVKIKLTGKATIKQVDKQLIERLQVMCFVYDIEELVISGGFRSFEEQEALYKKWLSGTGYYAAEPGKSWHEYGCAVDISNDALKRLPDSAFEPFGLIRPVTDRYGKHETWHIQIEETKGISGKKDRSQFEVLERWG